jgi:uncharacterized metal-binding protein
MAETKKDCACGAAPKLVFACSGAADTAEIADRAARWLTKAGMGRMYCLAGIGGRVDTILETTRQAAGILAIDGCPTDCARKTLEQAGFTDLLHIRVTDLGMEKGKSPATEERIRVVVEKAGETLR